MNQEKGAGIKDFYTFRPRPLSSGYWRGLAGDVKKLCTCKKTVTCQRAGDTCERFGEILQKLSQDVLEEIVVDGGRSSGGRFEETGVYDEIATKTKI